MLEKNAKGGSEIFSDLKKKFLDLMVDNNKKMLQAEKDGLTKRVSNTLAMLNKVFSDKDDLLNKQAYPPCIIYLLNLCTPNTDIKI